jgi:soluble lytic murein transglycosylase-like protein
VFRLPNVVQVVGSRFDCRRSARRLLLAAGLSVAALARAQLPSLDDLPRPPTPPPERGQVVPAQVERWRNEARAYEYGEGVDRDPVRAAELYCRAARYGDAEAQYDLGWMLTNARGIERDDAQAAHLFAAAAEQGHVQAAHMIERMGTPLGPPPPCLRPPEEDRAVPPPPPKTRQAAARPQLPAPPPPPNAPAAIVRFVDLVAPEYKLQPQLVLAVMAAESNFDPGAVSPKNAQGLMQLLPETAARFGVRNLRDPVQNIRGGMAYLRWLLAYFEGDLTLALAAYNAGEKAVERYRGVPPYIETRLYVLKIRVGLRGQTTHPFDPTVTRPSDQIALLQSPWRPR